MEEEETLQERRENELVLLQAIFMDSFQDLRQNDTWKVCRPPEIRITLQPQQSMTADKEMYVQVDLHICCTEEYPENPPKIMLENAKGLSNVLLEELGGQLQKFAAKLKGEVMILELTQHVQKFLHENNKAPAKSFYEEMVSNQRRQKEEQAKEELERQKMERIRQELQCKEIQEEINRRQEALREARRKRSLSNNAEEKSEETLNEIKHLLLINNIFHNSSPPLKSEIVSERRRQSICNHTGTSSLTFHNRTVIQGKCLAHSPRGCVTFHALDARTGEMMIVIEWVVHLSPFKKKMTTEEQEIYQRQKDGFLKQILILQQEFTTFQKLCHKNLSRYLSIDHSTEREQIVVRILQEYVPGYSLSSHFVNKVPVELSLLRHYTEEIIEGLNYLHENSIIHRDLRATSLLLDNTGTVKMVDYSIDKRLFDMYNSSRKEPLNDEYPPASGRGGKKGDVHRLGIIVLSLICGKLVKDVYPTIPNTFPPELQDFLRICLQPNEKERWSVSELANHSFLRPDLVMNPSPKKSEIEETKPNGDVVEPLLMNQISTDRFGSTRLDSEFEVLEWLGKGGFGDVLKVRNKLDGRVYALKRILLNPSRHLLNRKIMREVKLLSRLNHENVVRYYNSWIETTLDVHEEETSITETSPTSPSKEKSKTRSDNFSSLNGDDCIEKLAPPVPEESVDWSFSFDFAVGLGQDDFDSSDDDEDDFEAGVFSPPILSKQEQSESVLFEHNESKMSSGILKASDISSEESKPTEQNSPCFMQFMFIQMEFCENSTLRSAIDDGLYKDRQRMWRLFREIIEGLLHIHQQGMIHRDLKPVNIFLDSSDHVKIGDFGLATTDMKIKSSILDVSNIVISGHHDEGMIEFSDVIGDGTQTGRVGTALYVAPELVTPSSGKIIYNQKVDIYSLGIIFFEMCYPAPSTGMERIKLLVSLRRPEVALPCDAHLQLAIQQIELIKWLLHHDTSQRPNAEELLASNYLPPPHLEEAELNEMLRHTVSNPQSRAYKLMIKSLFRQDVTPGADFSYDMDIYKSPNYSSWSLNVTINIIQKIMQRHGALLMPIPTLMPKCQNYQYSEAWVSLMDHSGGIVVLPNDLRVLFARFVARREVQQLKRYTIEKVYRGRKIYGCHPREIYECAFDVVTTTLGNFLSDAEVITVISEIISEFSLLQQSQECYIRINHKNLILAVMIYCGIPDSKHSELLLLLSDIKARMGSKLQAQAKFANLGISEQSISLLLQFVEVEDSFQRIQTLLKPITKKRGRNIALAVDALRELETIISHLEAFGVKIPILVAPDLIFGSHVYSGMMFQVVYEVKKKNQKVKKDILAAGGRYDSLVSKFRLSSFSSGSRESYAVGVTIALEKIFSGYVLRENAGVRLSSFSVMVCSVGNSPMLKEKCDVLQRLWAHGVNAQVVYDCSLSLEEIMAQCREMTISHVLILKDLDLTHIRLRTLEKDRFTEKKVSLNELMDYIDQLEGNMSSKADVSRSCSAADLLERTASERCPTSSSGPSVKITFLPLEKMTGPNKRRHDALIQTHLTTILPQLASKANVEVIAVDLGSAVIRSISSYLELDGEEEDFKSSLSVIIDKHPRHRKYLAQVWDLINTIRLDKKTQVLVLYGLVESNCKVIFKMTK